MKKNRIIICLLFTLLSCGSKYDLSKPIIKDIVYIEREDNNIEKMDSTPVTFTIVFESNENIEYNVLLYLTGNEFSREPQGEIDTNDGSHCGFTVWDNNEERNNKAFIYCSKGSEEYQMNLNLDEQLNISIEMSE